MTDDRKNICRRLSLRQVDGASSHTFRRDFFGCRAQIDRLGLEAELKGHASCVNCLEWNHTGRLLASGSDDQKAIVWDIEAREVKVVHHTGHDGNIFSVKFLPLSDDNIVATAAADSEVRLHDLQRRETIYTFRNRNRVKRLATAPDTPHTFWSGAEDGTIRQYDMREPTDKQASTLVDVSRHNLEIKCLTINPIRTHLIAAGCSDPYVRVFDLRKLAAAAVVVAAAAGSPPPPPPPPYAIDAPVHYFCPGHLNSRRRLKRYRQYAVTYATWSPDGDGRELLVNLGAEQVYLYDILEPRRALYFESFGTNGSSPCNGMAVDVETSHSSVRGDVASSLGEMPKRATELKLLGNVAFREQQYSKAIYLYSEAMVHAVNQPVLYSNRAAAYLKRSWFGDVYAALRDCYTSLSLDPSNYKAHLRQANCLHQLKWHNLALDSIRRFQRQFPDLTEKSKSLAKDIEADANKANTKSENGGSGGETNQANRDANSAESLEYDCQRKAIDFKTHYCGHCNTTTDIKEVSFIGGRSQYVAAGSDDGRFFIWEKATGRLVRALKGDEAIVNCVQPHPHHMVVATSGIDPVIRLWSPRAIDSMPCGIDDSAATANDQDLSKIAGENQKRMRTDPLELMLMNMGVRLASGSDEEDDDDGGDESDGDEARHFVRRVRPHGCQPS